MADAPGGWNKEKELENIFSDFTRQKEVRRDEEKQQQSSRGQKRRLLRLALGLVGGVTALVLTGIVITVLSRQDSPLRFPPPWAVGERLESDYRLDDCISRLWKVRAAVDRYYGRHKQLPLQMSALYEDDLLPAHFSCSVSGEEYVIRELYGQRVCACPRAQEHGKVSELYLEIRNGPPIIERNIVDEN